MSEHTDVFFDDSPVFKLAPGAEAAGVKKIGWFDSATPLSQWLPVLTNAFEASGNFSATNLIDPSTPKRFFLLQTP